MTLLFNVIFFNCIFIFLEIYENLLHQLGLAACKSGRIIVIINVKRRKFAEIEVKK